MGAHRDMISAFSFGVFFEVSQRMAYLGGVGHKGVQETVCGLRRRVRIAL